MPATFVRPPSSEEARVVAGFCPTALLYAVVKSVWAAAAAAVLVTVKGASTWPGGNPPTAMVGLEPTFPVMTLGPVLVTPAPAKTAYVEAFPRGMDAWAAAF